MPWRSLADLPTRKTAHVTEQALRDMPGGVEYPGPSAAVQLEKAPRAILPSLLFHGITGPLSVLALMEYLPEFPGVVGQVLRYAILTLGWGLNTAAACILHGQAVAVLDSRPASASAALTATLRAWRGILTYSILAVIALAVFRALPLFEMDMLLWLAITVVAFTYIAARLAFTLPLLVLERRPLLDALRTSWQRTRGYLLALIGYSLLSWFAVFLLFEPWMYLITDGPLREALNTFSLQLTLALWTLVSATYYHRTRPDADVEPAASTQPS